MKIRKAVFPAAGLGTRFLPATKASPKEMLPIVDKPMIQYAVEEVIASGVKEIILITGRGKNAIEDHFDRSFELEYILSQKKNEDKLKEVQRISEMCDFCYVRQKEALGLGHAILLSKELVGNEAFVVLLGDDLVLSEVPAISQLIDVYTRFGKSVIAVEPVDKETISQYGVIKGKPVEDGLYLIEDLVEKPKADQAPSNLAIIGRYVLTPEIFSCLENTVNDATGEIQLTDGLRLLLKEQAIYAYQFKGRRYDAGSKLGFLKATVEFALRREDLGEEFREYLKSLTLSG